MPVKPSFGMTMTKILRPVLAWFGSHVIYSPVLILITNPNEQFTYLANYFNVLDKLTKEHQTQNIMYGKSINATFFGKNLAIKTSASLT